MKKNDLDKYIVKHAEMADMNSDENHPSTSGERLLSYYDEDLQLLFNDCEDLDINTILVYLKSQFSNIRSIEPIN